MRRLEMTLIQLGAAVIYDHPATVRLIDLFLRPSTFLPASPLPILIILHLCHMENYLILVRLTLYFYYGILNRTCLYAELISYAFFVLDVVVFVVVYLKFN